jgi:protein-tyrosine phosphatase
MGLQVKGIIKRLLPHAVIDFVHEYRSVSPDAKLSYIMLRVLKAWRGKEDNFRNMPARANSVLFVCSGNIIRSPMAAELLKRYLPDTYRETISITSAGLHAQESCSADPRARVVAREFGVSLDDHSTERLSADSVAKADVIFVMDYRNEAELLARYPRARGKTALLGAYAEGRTPHQLEIKDPYGGDRGDIRRCYKTLESCIRHLASVLVAGRQDELAHPS